MVIAMAFTSRGNMAGRDISGAGPIPIYVGVAVLDSTRNLWFRMHLH